jgi:triosephosphate isomerase
MIRDHLDSRPDFAESARHQVAAQDPACLPLKGSVDGLFLGRFAHDPSALERVLSEALDGSATTTAGPLPTAGRPQWQ